MYTPFDKRGYRLNGGVIRLLWVLKPGGETLNATPPCRQPLWGRRVALVRHPCKKCTTRQRGSEAGNDDRQGQMSAPFSERVQRAIRAAAGVPSELSLECLSKMGWYEESMIDALTTTPKYPAWRGVLGTVAQECGPEVAMALLEKMPGVRFYVPAKYTDTGPLAVLGKEHAEAVIAVFAKDIIYIPSQMATTGTPEERLSKKQALLDAIEAQILAGCSTQEIARILGISQGYVFMLRREFGAEKIASIRKRQKALKLEGPVA